MRIQESLVTNKQIALELHSENGRYRLPFEGKDYYFPTLEKVHEAFLSQDTYDTIKLTHEGKKSYLHLFMDEIEVFDTKKALRQRLSQDSQGMWAEIRNGKTHYYKEEKGWTSTSYKEITEQECIEKLKHTSTMTKVLGIGLGIIALLPGALEFARHLPIGTKEAAMGLVALNHKSPVLGAVGYSLIPKQVEAQALGTEFQVNTYTTKEQRFPSVAPLNNGGFVVTWYSNGQDGDSNGIFGQTYDANGDRAGSEFQVNSYTTGSQIYPKVASLNNGDFVVIWQSVGQDGDLEGIFGQRYDSNGSPAGPEFQVNTYTTSNQERPSVTSLNNGGFVVTWESDDQDGDNWGIYRQRYDSNGSAAGTEFQVNTYTTREQARPSVAPLNDGGFVVTWESGSFSSSSTIPIGQDGDRYGIFGQRYDSNGSAAGTEFQVNTYSTNNQRYPSIALINDGGFVIAWASFDQDGDDYGIYGQRYDSSGIPVDSEFQVNTYTTNTQSGPNIAPLNDGGFVVVWQSSDQDGSGTGIYGQRYDSSGLTSGTEFQANTYTQSLQTNPSVAPLNDGGFVIAWESSNFFGTSAWPSITTFPIGQDGDSFGIFGQRYDASGNPIPLQIGSSTNATSTMSAFPTAPTQNTSTPSFLTSRSPTPLTTNMLPSSTAASPTPNSPTPSPSSPPSSSLGSTLTSTTMASATRDSKSQTTFSSHSGSKATSTFEATTPTSLVSSIVSVGNIVYEESYPILVNDQVVGSYTVSGGTGLLDSGNHNVIYFDFDPSFQPEEGQIITLFYVPEEEIALWESIEIEGESYECLEARGQVATNQGRSSYQMVFEDTECLAVAPMMLATALPLALN